MRVNSLEVTAFGPFAQTQRLDFADLNQAGLFLLTGPTGAGKTSVLDAICFALYGSVPGDRGSAKDLKSHHAGADDAPLVELDVSIRGRRFRVGRSPGWSRPSRRARSGIAEQPAHARLSEWSDGEWRPVSSRIDEIGHLLRGLLGMSRDQFCQVVLLPQGKFQTFLSAGAKERHDVLEALFETGRFKRIEAWLADHRRSCDAALGDQEARLSELAARIEEANAGPLVEPVDDSASRVDRRTLDALTETCQRLTEAVVAAQAQFVERQEVAKVAQHDLDEAKALVDRQTRHAEARRALDELDATADRLIERERRVELARAAAAVLPFVETADRACERLARLTRDVDALRTSLADAGLDVEQGPAGAAAAADGLRTALATVEALGPLAADVESERRRATNLTAEAARVERELAEAVAAVAAAEGDAVDDDALAHLRARAAGLDEVAQAARQAEIARDAAREAATLEPAATEAQAAVVAARGGALDAREAWLSARELRLESSAAILAAELADGVACPVCGSVDHPSPAPRPSAHVGADDERDALARLDALDKAVSQAAERAAEVGRRLALAHGRAGGLDVVAAESALDVTRSRQRAASQAAAELHGALASSNRQRERLEVLQASVRDGATRSTDTAARLDEAAKSLRRKERRLRKALGADETVDSRVADLTIRLEACAALSDAETAAAAAHEAATDDDGRLSDALAASPFETADDVRAAALAQVEIANAEALNRSARAARAAAERTLADPVLTASAAADSPDLESLQRHVDDAHAELIDAGGAVERHTARLARLERLGTQLQTELDAIAPLLDARDVAASVAAMCAGTSPDNKTRTRLSHYVLSERLRQVVEAANERLAGIASGRYELVHTMDRGVGDTRGGLSLRVYDAHTGRARDPATLSGGEGFYVSLALALGLADLVRDEIGGLELSTLFVDEGFGMLDAETLDEVMDELDSLRTGGRAVGIVSHLHELRLRIPAHVQVVPSPSGSVIATA
jgi:DNA repair protein SbcC/Rad50